MVTETGPVPIEQNERGESMPEERTIDRARKKPVKDDPPESKPEK
jgi:hypothetical protein